MIVNGVGNWHFLSSPSAHTPSQLAQPLALPGQASLRRLMKVLHPPCYQIPTSHCTQFCLQFLGVPSGTAFDYCLPYFPHANSLQEKAFSQGGQNGEWQVAS